MVKVEVAISNMFGHLHRFESMMSDGGVDDRVVNEFDQEVEARQENGELETCHRSDLCTRLTRWSSTGDAIAPSTKLMASFPRMASLAYFLVQDALHFTFELSESCCHFGSIERSYFAPRCQYRMVPRWS